MFVDNNLSLVQNALLKTSVYAPNILKFLWHFRQQWKHEFVHCLESADHDLAKTGGCLKVMFYRVSCETLWIE